MGKHILIGLLGGILVMGISTAYAEGPQPSEQEVVKGHMEVKAISEPSTREGKHGPQLLTDEELGQITGAGLAQFDFGLGSSALNHLAGFATLKALRFGKERLGIGMNNTPEM